MALALVLDADLAAADGTTHTVELYQEGYGGASGSIILQSVIERYGDRSDEINTPLRRGEVTATFLPIDATSGVIVPFLLTKLQEIAQGGGREWLLVYKKNAVEAWRGWVRPRFTTTEYHDGNQVVSVTAQDGLQNLNAIAYPDGSQGAAATSVVLADLLALTGHSLTFRSNVVWAPDGHTGLPFVVQVNRDRYEQLSNDRTRMEQALSGDVLASLLRSFGLTCVQHSGEWYLMDPLETLDSTSSVHHRYTSSGSWLSSPSSNNRRSLTTFAYLHGTGVVAGADRLSRSEATYAYGRLDLGGLVNGNFSVWDPDDDDQAEGWTYTGGTSGVEFERSGTLPAVNNFELQGGPRALHIKGQTVADGAADDTYAAACGIFATQDAGTFAAGTTGVTFSFWYGVRGSTPQGALSAGFTRMYYRVKFVDATNTYYFDTTDTWTLTGSLTAAQRARRCTSGTDPTGTASGALDKLGQLHEVLLDAMPGSGNGTLTIELGQPVYSDLLSPGGGFGGGVDEIWGIYDLVAISRGDDDSSGRDGIRYIVEATDVDEGYTTSVTLFNGDGPFDGAQGSFLNHAGAITGGWLRRPLDAAIPHTRLVAQEAIRFARDNRSVVSFTTPGIAYTNSIDVFPARRVLIDGVYYWPVYVETRWPTGEQTVYAIELVDGGTGSLSESDEAAGINASLLAANPQNVFFALQDAFNTLVRSATTVTTAKISSGSQTTATINPVQGDVFKDNESIAIVDRITAETYFLTMNGDYSGGGTSITFDAYTFPHDVAVGSYVFADQEATLARFAVTESAFNLTIQAGELCQANETVSSPTARSSMTVDGLRYDIRDNDVFKLIRADGTAAYTLVSRADQTATSSTFLFDNGAGGNVTITCAPGDSIVPDGAQVYSLITSSASTINLSVNTLLESQMIGKLSGAQSGTKTSILLQSGSAFPVMDNQKIIVGTLADDDWEELTVNGDQAAGTNPIVIDSVSITQQDEALVLSAGNATAAAIAINQDNIDLSVTKTEYDERLLGALVGLLNGAHSTAARSTISIKTPQTSGGSGTSMDVKEDAVLVVVDGGSGTSHYVRVTGDQLAGSASIGVEDLDGTTVNFPTTMDDGSPVYIYTGHPEVIRTGLNIGLNGIDVEARIFKSTDWNGTYNTTTGAITAAGTTGWAISGGGDADITGALHAGGGAVEIDTDGINIIPSTGFALARAITFLEGASQRLNIWHHTGVNQSKIEFNDTAGGEITSQNDIDLITLSTGDINLTTGSGDIVLTSQDDIILDANGDVNVQDGNFIVDTNVLYVDATNNRVGIVKASPTVALDVVGSCIITGNTRVEGYLEMKEQTAPGTPATGLVRLYFKSSDGKLYYKDDAGTELEIATVP